jgi:hypothetical protein
MQIKAMAGSAMDPRTFGFIDAPSADGVEAALINLKQVCERVWMGVDGCGRVWRRGGWVSG